MMNRAELQNKIDAVLGGSWKIGQGEAFGGWIYAESTIGPLTLLIECHAHGCVGRVLAELREDGRWAPGGVELWQSHNVQGVQIEDVLHSISAYLRGVQTELSAALK